MQKKYKTAVLIGRFQPFHNGHLEIVKKAFGIAEDLVIVLGSANSPRIFKNPWTTDERKEYVLDAILDAFPDKRKNITITWVEDKIYNNLQWAADVQYKVHYSTQAEGKEIVLVGHHRDNTSFYLDMFKQWSYYEVQEMANNISGTDIRNKYFGPAGVAWGDKLPMSVTKFLMDFKSTDIYKTMKAEHEYVLNYKKRWEAAPYTPTFVTTDAVVVQSGHILMIKRGGFPGKGLWALPGGFLDQNETIKECILRELTEETSIKVPDNVLRRCLVDIQVFDSPNRSSRGRTITHAGLIILDDDHKLPKVKGADDADKAWWIPLSVIKSEMRDKIFEDHYDIIIKMTNSL